MLPVPRDVLAWARPDQLPGKNGKPAEHSLLSMPPPPAGAMRRVVIDVGASTGIFTALSASRGYDVIAIEPLADQAARVAISAEASGARLPLSANEAIARASTRQAAALTDARLATSAPQAATLWSEDQALLHDALSASSISSSSPAGIYSSSSLSDWLMVGAQAEDGLGSSQTDAVEGPAPHTVAQVLRGEA